VFREFKAIKHDKFPDHQINRWYDALIEAGLIQKPLTAIGV
jgi:hypothetical protein